MKEIRNPAGRLVCRIDELTGAVEILEKGWLTVLRCNRDGTVKVLHFSRNSVR